MQNISSAGFADTKPHYELLDGLRGVAALLVLWHHVFEGYAFAEGAPIIEGINHGYLAVDFFFMLSGFVIAYAYDDRWNKNLTMKGFFKRRLIRLHPMVVLAAVIGAITFFMQGSVKWDGTEVATSLVMVALLMTIFFIPATGTPYEVRGNGEMYPLNGPGWSLFFEYIGNILYAFFIRRLSNKVLGVLTFLMGAALAAFVIFDVSGYGNLGVGWTLDTMNFIGGFLRMMFPFSMGMLLARNFRPMQIRGAFWICSAVLFALFHVPFIPGNDGICINGLFEAFCIIAVFPMVVWLGASGKTTDSTSTKLCKFLGDISYPLYIVHYPVFYLFYAWLIEEKLYTLGETWVAALGVCVLSVVLAYACLKLYDEPVRKWLTKKYMK